MYLARSPRRRLRRRRFHEYKQQNLRRHRAKPAYVDRRRYCYYYDDYKITCQREREREAIFNGDLVAVDYRRTRRSRSTASRRHAWNFLISSKKPRHAVLGRSAAFETRRNFQTQTNRSNVPLSFRNRARTTVTCVRRTAGDRWQISHWYGPRQETYSWRGNGVRSRE